MRHLLLTGDAVGGVWTYCLELCRGLAANGVRTSLAVLGPRPQPAQLREAASIDALQVITTDLALEWTCDHAGALRSAGAVLAGMAGRLRVDAVHLHTPALVPEIAWPVPVVCVAHSDVGTWWSAVHGGRLPDDLAWRAQAVGHGLAEADAVIAPSAAYASALEAFYQPGRSITIVHNGRSAPNQHTMPPIERTARVLTAGRLWDAGKNLVLLDRAAPSIGVEIIAAGALAGPHGASTHVQNIRCLGTLSTDALTQQMHQASVFVSCARYEPFGLAVLEAAGAGMALALSDIPTHRELWDGAALFFHPEDSGALADVARRLLAQPQAHAARARDRARQYSKEAMLHGTLEVYAAIAQRRAA